MTHANGHAAAQNYSTPEVLLGAGFYNSEVTHRIANNLTLLASSISLRARHFTKQDESLTGEEVGAILAEVSARIAAVGQLHRDISAQPEAEHLDINQHLRTLCDSLIAAVAQPGQFTLTQTEFVPCAIRTDKVLPVSMIVTEIVTNSLKYAHPSGVRGTVSLGCRREADGGLLIEVSDDGVGLPEGFNPATDGGLGSRTVAMLARQLMAEVTYVPQPIGLRFQLRLPASIVS